MLRLLRPIIVFLNNIRMAFSRIFWSMLLAEFGTGARIYSTAIIRLPRRVKIGKNVVINDFVHIWGGGGVSIGEDTMIAAHSVLVSQTHEPRAAEDGKLFRETLTFAPIVIGCNVWIGSNVTILPGVNVGDNSILAAGAVVNKDVQPGTIVAGVPAKFVRELKGSH